MKHVSLDKVLRIIDSWDGVTGLGMEQRCDIQNLEIIDLSTYTNQIEALKKENEELKNEAHHYRLLAHERGA